MTIKFRLYVAAAALLSLSSAAAYVYRAGAERATLEQRLHASDSTIAELRERSKRVDVRYIRDTVLLRAKTQRYDSIVTRWDTVSVPVAPETVRVIVQAGQQALTACSAVILTCEQRVASRDSIIAALSAQRPLLIASQPSRFKRLSINAAKIGGGVALGYLTCRAER